MPRWEEVSGVSRMAQTRRRLPHRGLGTSAGRISRREKTKPCESRLSRLRQDRRLFPVHTPQPQHTHPALTECVFSCCTFAFPSPPAEPPVPGMFHPCRRCLQDAAHPEQQHLFQMPVLLLHDLAREKENCHAHTHMQTHVMREQFATGSPCVCVCWCVFVGASLLVSIKE